MQGPRGMVAVIAFLALSVSLVGSSTSAFVLPTCLQDQYGNQYNNLVVDQVHGLVTGTVLNNQGCSSDAWTMIGSWSVNSNRQTILELSVGNNTTGSSCSSTLYKLKGPYPHADWNYTDGYGAQPFRYAACSANSAVVPNTFEGGTRGPKPE